MYHADTNEFSTLSFQHFREHLDKLFAKGIGMLDIALNEAFNILSDVSSSLIAFPLSRIYVCLFVCFGHGPALLLASAVTELHP